MEGLKDRSTVFKDLRYGHDREGGGSSNQPYIKQPLNVKLPPAFNFLGNDFILRGGPIGAPLATANDLARLTKYFTDVKTPSGLLFIAKQNLLSRTAVNTEASGKLVNEGVYTPLSTLAQAGVSAFGLHLNKQGLNPIPGAPGSLRTYQSVVIKNNAEETNGIQAGYTREIINPNYVSFDQSAFESQLQASELGPDGIGDIFGSSASPLTPPTINEVIPAKIKYTNRLLNYWYYKQMTQNATPNITSYRGGPGSILGVGTTFIKFATVVEVADGKDRSVKSNFDIKLNGYLIPDVVQKDVSAIKKIPVVTKTIFGIETTSNINQVPPPPKSTN